MNITYDERVVTSANDWTAHFVKPETQRTFCGVRQPKNGFLPMPSEQMPYWMASCERCNVAYIGGQR